MPELTKITPIASLLEFSATCLPAAEGLALPDLLWIDTDNLLLDPSYQRGISRIGQRTIKKIIGQFDWMKFGALIVAKSGTDFAVIDGQHRAIAAIHLQLPKVPALVGSSDHIAQADAFVGINKNRTRVGPLDEYRAALVAGAPDALAVQSILDRLGIQLEAETGEIRPGRTRAITTLLTLTKNMGADRLEHVLEMLTDTHPDTRNLLSASNVTGVAEAYRRAARAGIDPASLKPALAMIDFEQIDSRARELVRLIGGNKKTHFTGQLVKALNKILPNKIPEKTK